MKADRNAFFTTDRWTGLLFTWSLGMDEARLQLFRFVDALPALTDDADVVRHLRGYFADRAMPFAQLMRFALGRRRSSPRSSWSCSRRPGFRLAS